MLFDLWASLAPQTVKRLSAMQVTWVRSLGWEDPLEKEMAARSSILAWKIPWTADLIILRILARIRKRHKDYKGRKRQCGCVHRKPKIMYK